MSADEIQLNLLSNLWNYCNCNSIIIRTRSKRLITTKNYEDNFGAFRKILYKHFLPNFREWRAHFGKYQVVNTIKISPLMTDTDCLDIKDHGSKRLRPSGLGCHVTCRIPGQCARREQSDIPRSAWCAMKRFDV